MIIGKVQQKNKKANFAVQKMKQWNQSESGIKEGIDFVKDNTQNEGIKNTVNNKGEIDSGAKNLQMKLRMLLEMFL